MGSWGPKLSPQVYMVNAVPHWAIYWAPTHSLMQSKALWVRIWLQIFKKQTNQTKKQQQQNSFLECPAHSCSLQVWDIMFHWLIFIIYHFDNHKVGFKKPREMSSFLIKTIKANLSDLSVLAFLNQDISIPKLYWMVNGLILSPHEMSRCVLHLCFWIRFYLVF